MGEGKGKEKKKFFDRSPRHKFPTLSVTQRRNQDYTSKRVVCRGVVTKLAVIKLATAKLDGTHDRMLLFLVCIYLYSILYFLFSLPLSSRVYVSSRIFSLSSYFSFFLAPRTRFCSFIPHGPLFRMAIKAFFSFTARGTAFARFLVVRD